MPINPAIRKVEAEELQVRDWTTQQNPGSNKKQNWGYSSVVESPQFAFQCQNKNKTARSFCPVEFKS